MIERKYATGDRSPEGDSLTRKLVPRTVHAESVALALAFRRFLTYGTYHAAPDLSESEPGGETAPARGQVGHSAGNVAVLFELHSHPIQLQVWQGASQLESASELPPGKRSCVLV